MKREYIIDERNMMARFYYGYNDPDKDTLKARIKNATSEAHWNDSFKCWNIPINYATKEDISWIITKYDFVKKVEEKIVFPKYNHSIPEKYLDKITQICKDRNFAYTPRHYQIEALYYGLQKKNFINGDDVGVGKTLESIVYTEALQAFPCIVIVPASVKYQWGEKWSEIVGEHRTISIIESKETKNRKNNWNADVIIINYDILAKVAGKGIVLRFPELGTIKWKMHILDEGHFCKEEKSQRSKAVAKITSKTTFPIQLLTGTASMSRPIELWNLLKIIKQNHLIAKTKEEFLNKYCGAYRGKYGVVNSGATNSLELNHNLRQNCYIRREKREVLEEMPPVTSEIINMQIDNEKEIKRAMSDLYGYLLETKGLESAENAMEAESLVLLGVLRKLSIEGKLKAIEQYLNDWKECGKKLVIFGVHRETLEYLANKFNSPLIAGGVSSIKKRKIVKAWIESEDLFLFGNISSIGTGTDGLQEVCSDALVLELPWRPSDIAQLVGRLDRSGQKEPTNFRYLLSRLTIDVEMWSMLSDKEITTEAINKGVDLQNEEGGMKMVWRKLMLKLKNNSK